MDRAITRAIEEAVEAYYLEDHSHPDQQQFVFAYRVHLKNHGLETVQLISRHWIITDSIGEVQHVKGEGVVGEQPVLKPGEEYEYVSGSHLKSEMGTMHGTYQMVRDDGEPFDVEIPCFTLAVPGIVN